MQRITSIKEIAKLADCSIATVSNVLNGKGRVSEKIKDKIFTICREHGYLPNSAGRNLRRRQNEIIGLMFYPSCSAIFSNIFYAEVMEALEAVMEERGFDILLAGSDFQKNPTEPPRFMRQGKIDGVILLGGFPKEAVSELHRFGLPLLFLDNHVDGVPVDSVITDGFGGCQQTVEHLVAQGHRDILFMAHRHEDFNASDREAGFLAAVKSHGLSETACRSIRDFANTEEAYALLKQELASSQPPTAIIAVNDTLGAELSENLQADGRSIPEDLTIFGFNDDYDSRRVHPQLSTVRINKQAMGKMGAQMILDRIDNPDAALKSIKIPVELVHRGSEGKPRR